MGVNLITERYVEDRGEIPAKVGGEGGVITSPCQSTMRPTPFDLYPTLSPLNLVEGVRGNGRSEKGRRNPLITPLSNIFRGENLSLTIIPNPSS